MAAVAILMFPEPGHLLPTLRIASRIRDEGHRVTYLVTRPFMSALCRLGFRVRELFSDLLPDANEVDALCEAPLPATELWTRLAARAGLPSHAIRGIVRAVARDHVIPSLVASEADVILCDAKIVAACGDLIRRTCPAELIALRTELPIGDALDCPELVLCPAELEIPHFRMAVQGRIYCEPSVADGGVRRATPAHTADERLVYCSLGTQAASYPDAPRVLRAVVDAFGGRAGHRLVMVAGALASHEVLKDVPANVIVERVVDQMAVLREASLTILHGGLGGVKEAIWCGVPMVLVPFAFDQRPNADRVSFHGLGETCLPDDCDAHTLWACACRQFDSANRAAIDTMRQTFRMAEHAEPAARFVLDVLARRAHGAVRC